MPWWMAGPLFHAKKPCSHFLAVTRTPRGTLAERAGAQSSASLPRRTQAAESFWLVATAAVTNTDGCEKSLSVLGRPSTADAHSRGHGMAQVALSRAQPSCPHCPPSRSPRARPFTFTSAAGRELGDRAALVHAIRYKGATSSSASCVARTQHMPHSRSI